MCSCLLIFLEAVQLRVCCQLAVMNLHCKLNCWALVWDHQLSQLAFRFLSGNGTKCSDVQVFFDKGPDLIHMAVWCRGLTTKYCASWLPRWRYSWSTMALSVAAGVSAFISYSLVGATRCSVSWLSDDRHFVAVSKGFSTAMTSCRSESLMSASRRSSFLFYIAHMWTIYNKS